MTTVAEILTKAESLGVRLTLNGESVRMTGPKEGIATLRPDVAAHKLAIVARLRAADSVPGDCDGALVSRDGGLYLPWCAPIPGDQVRVLMTELIALIESLADAEGWPKDCRDGVLGVAIRGPLADLMPNLHYFRERAAEARALYKAQQAMRERAWQAGEDLTNRGYR